MAVDPGTVTVEIYDLPSNVTPTITGISQYTTNMYYNSSVNHWIGFTAESYVTFPVTISAEGYIPVTLTSYSQTGGAAGSILRSSMVVLPPSHLYGWTDSSVSDITLYAWDAKYADSPTVLYTKDAVPTSSSKYYDVNGNEIQLSSITYDGWVATGLKYGNSNNIAFDCSGGGDDIIVI